MNIEETDYMRGYMQATRESSVENGRGAIRKIRNATNSMLCWNINSNDVRLVDWPDIDRESSAFLMSTLACYSEIRNASLEYRKTHVFVEFVHLVVRDGVDPVALHNVMMDLDEYRDGLADDMLRSMNK